MQQSQLRSYFLVDIKTDIAMIIDKIIRRCLEVFSTANQRVFLHQECLPSLKVVEQPHEHFAIFLPQFYAYILIIVMLSW